VATVVIAVVVDVQQAQIKRCGMFYGFNLIAKRKKN